MKIEIKAGPNAGQQHDIEDSTVVGRDPASATLVIDDPEASRRHASLTPGGDGVVVEDLGSTNGTYVNGDRIDGTRNAGAGDEVRIGNTVIEVQTTIEATRTSSAPEPSDPDATAIGSPVPDAPVGGPPAPEPAGGPPAPPAPEPPSVPEPPAAPQSPPPEPYAAPQPPVAPPAPPLATSEPPGPPPPPPGGGGAPPPPPPAGGQGAGAPPQGAPPQSPPPQFSPPGSPPGSYPPVAYGGGGSSYPIDFDVQYPANGIDRWRPFFAGFLLIPHAFALAFVGIGVFFAFVVAWFAILFTGKYPEGIFNFVAGFFRWQIRVGAYGNFMVDKYPPFSLDQEPQYPTMTRIDYPPGGEIARWRVFVQGIMAFPHWVVLFFLGIARGFVIVVAFFAVLFTRKWPEGLFKFVVGTTRWGLRVGAYTYLMTEQYPPFQLDP